MKMHNEISRIFYFNINQKPNYLIIGLIKVSKK